MEREFEKISLLKRQRGLDGRTMVRRRLGTLEEEVLPGVGLRRAGRGKRSHHAFLRRVWETVDNYHLAEEQKLFRFAEIYRHDQGRLTRNEKMLLYCLIVDSLAGACDKGEMHRYRAIAEHLWREAPPEGLRQWSDLGNPALVSHYLQSCSQDMRLTTTLFRTALPWIQANIPSMSVPSVIRSLRVIADLDIQTDSPGQEGDAARALTLALEESLSPDRQSLCPSGMLLHAIDALSIVSPGMADRLWGREDITGRILRESSTPSYWIRLHQLAKYAGVTLPEEAQMRVRDAIAAREKRISLPNDFERAVQVDLEKLQIDFVYGARVEGFEVDFLVKYADRQVVVECSGDRYHFIDSDPRRGFRGMDRLRNTVLQMAGCPVLHIPSSSLRAYPGEMARSADRIERALKRVVRSGQPEVHILGV